MAFWRMEKTSFPLALMRLSGDCWARDENSCKHALLALEHCFFF